MEETNGSIEAYCTSRYGHLTGDTYKTELGIKCLMDMAIGQFNRSCNLYCRGYVFGLVFGPTFFS